MENFLHFINTNHTIIMVILTAIYVFVTIGILIVTTLSNKISKENLLNISRPYVFLDLFPQNKNIYLRVKNTGVTSAYDITSDINNEQISQMVNKVRYLGPGVELKFYLGNISSFKEPIKGQIRYKDGFGKSYEESISEDNIIYINSLIIKN